MLKQLNPPIPLQTPKGEGLAHFLIDYSAEYDLMWVVFLNESGECWTFPNHQIRAQKNITMGRRSISEYDDHGKSHKIKPYIEHKDNNLTFAAKKSVV